MTAGRVPHWLALLDKVGFIMFAGVPSPGIAVTRYPHDTLDVIINRALVTGSPHPARWFCLYFNEISNHIAKGLFVAFGTKSTLAVWPPL